ncbi:MAG: ribokinase [SAR202 cluster bacterium]|jgi:ribokinase|nr:ribokinase [SAR202 cluster bacterium]
MITPSYKFSVCVIGGINIDFISAVKSMPKAGETIVGNDFVVTPGGKGANQAVACGRLGLKTSMIGRVGNDTFADQLLYNLNDEKINTDGITKDKNTHTGIATIILDENGENSIIQTPGANYLCGDDELNYLKDKISEFDLLVLQSEIPINISLSAAKIAKSAGKLVIWDPAPANELPDEAYKYIDYLIPNQTEAQTLSGLDDVLNEKQAIEASKIFLDKGVKNVIITMAEQGAFGYNGKESYFIDIPDDIKVIDSVAAGDAFSGGLSLGISEELEFKQLIIYGVLSGCIAVQKPGATDSMPTIKEFNSLQVKIGK